MIKARGITPPSVNNYWKPRIINGRFSGNYITKQGRDFKYYLHIIAKNAGQKLIEGDCRLIYRLYVKGRGRKDLDNTLKALQDALEGVAYHKDNQIVKIDALKVRNSDFEGFDLIVEEYDA